jgi:hypothetical protein
MGCAAATTHQRQQLLQNRSQNPKTTKAKQNKTEKIPERGETVLFMDHRFSLPKNPSFLLA